MQVEVVIQILILLLSISMHEYAHAKVADMCGDPTPSFFGRVTLNPLAHLDPMGTIMIIITSISGYGIGWGKPVMANPARMRNPRWDHFWSVAAGPISNIFQAIIYGILFRILVLAGVAELERDNIAFLVCGYGVLLNLGLAFFNLIPFGPLDGHWLVGAFLPERARDKWYLFSRTYGSAILLAIILSGQFMNFSIIGMLIYPPVKFFAKVILPDVPLL